MSAIIFLMPPEPVPPTPSLRNEIKEYWAELGPGLTTGAADDDPSGVVTYSQAGARYGLDLIWMTLFTYPFMAVVQEMCARIGLVSGRGLAANIRRHYAPSALYFVTGVLFFANVLNIAADLGAMAAATRLILPQFGAESLVVFFALLSLVLQIFTPYGTYAGYLKYLSFTLLAYVAVALAVGLDWGEVLYHTVVPTMTLSGDQLILLSAILGTTISPYLFFWQTSQEVEEEILRGQTSIAARRRQVTPEAIRVMRKDVWSGMGFSNVIAFFIFAACAGTLYVNGIRDIKTAEDAALALKSFGDFAFILFTLGIIGTGMLAVPVLAASTAYAMAESFGWRYGLFRQWKKATAFYGVIIIAMVLGILANFLHLDPIKSLIYAAAANGIVAPIVLYFVVRLSSSRHVMGEYTNSPLVKSVGWLTVFGMAGAGIAALLAMIGQI